MASILVTLDLCKIGHSGTGVENLKGVIGPVPSFLGQLHGLTLLVSNVAERNCVASAGLLTRGQDLAISNVPTFVLRRLPRRLDALNTEGTLFHNTLATDCDVRVEHHAEQTGPVLATVVEVVEAPDLLGSVIAAVASADAAVVHHAVDAFVGVVGRDDRADRLARRCTTVLAEHRQMPRVDFTEDFAIRRRSSF